MSLPSSVETQLIAILSKYESADCIALIWKEVFEGSGGSYEIKGQALKVIFCYSQLAMREQLVEHTGSERLVLLSPFSEAELANDILARLWKNEPQQISPWRTLKQILRVEMIDPRLTSSDYRWIAESLVSRYEKYQDKISFGEVLDQENAWRALAIGLLDYEEEVLDLPSLFKWSISVDGKAIIAKLPEDVRQHLIDWLRPSLPECAELLSLLLCQGHANDLVAVGLVCSVMYHKEIATHEIVEDQVLLQARIRFSERFLDGQSVPESAIKYLADQAVAYLEKELPSNKKAFNTSFASAEQILASLDLMPVAILSHLLPASYKLRLNVLSDALRPVVAAKSLTKAKNALHIIKSHAMAGEQVSRAEMAIRLYEWLQNHNKPDSEFNTIVADYIDHGGFVDWARSKLWSGDIHEGLSANYEKLSKKVSILRDALNQQFSEYLSDVAQGVRFKDEFIPVENVLDHLIVPLAKNKPVLLLVLDGMSQAVHRELTVDLVQNNWIELQQNNRDSSCLLATLPTITHVSRCSLLSGNICTGVAADEKKAFHSHPALKNSAKLFHKNDLQQPGSGALASDARAVIAGTQHHVVAAVINAIDDQLSSNAQVSVDWNMGKGLPLLKQVLEAAREAGRVVVVTSDHGHVLNHDMHSKKKGDAGERYKLDKNSINKGEVVLSGRRVVTQSKEVVLPWSEKIRYAASKMGYHGGGSLQEVIIPLGVFISESDSDIPENWLEIPRCTPDWWNINHEDLKVSVSDIQGSLVSLQDKKTIPKKPPSGETLDLFDSVANEKTSSDWLSALTTSSVYQQIKARAGRTAIKDELLLNLVKLLDENNGRLMTATLVHELSIPKIRLRGFLSGVQKLLNVDGYPVLSVDRQSGTVTLNIDSLKKQFEL